MAIRKGTKNPSGPVRGGRGKKASSNGQKKTHSWAILFWLAFTIIILGLFLFNREAITGSIQIIRNEIAAQKTPGKEKPPAGPAEKIPPATPPAQPTPPPATPPLAVPVAPPAATSPAAQPVSQQSPASSKPAPQPVNTQPVPAQPAPSAKAAPSPPAGKPAAPAQPAAQTPGQTPQAAPQTSQGTQAGRDRALYFIQVDRGGSILRVKVNRNIPVSDSPLTDVIQAMITGPNGDEKGKGLISLIPPATKILSATVRGDTAYINFSEDFQYNTYGVEGYAGQLRQIVFTATEFPNVTDVQILIEGRRHDYLGEGIWIGSPLNRDMF